MKKYFSFFIFAFLFLTFEFSTAQNVGIGTNAPNVSAQLDVTSTNRGFLPPRMTFAQRNMIINPAQGLMIYCTDCDSSGQPQFFNGTKWCNMLGGAASGIIPANLPSVTIGTQIWSSKNLDVAIYRNGDPIPQVTDPTDWSNLTTGAWCWYNNDSATYAATYGRLYNWYAVNDPRGLAPHGWHVPSDAEWTTLENCLGGSSVAGGAMKEAGTSHWASPNTGATNSSGFAGLPGGYRNNDGIFNTIGYFGFWWSSTEFDISLAWYRGLYYYSVDVGRSYNAKATGYSVRLVRD